MPVIKVQLKGDGAWPDLKEKMEKGLLYHLPNEPWQFITLASGMQSGKTSVALRLTLPDGKVVLAETSLDSFITAAQMLIEAHGVK